MAQAPLNPELFPVLRPDITAEQLRSLSYYQLLGAGPTTPLADLRTNYDLLSMYCYPSACPLPLPEVRFRLLAEAYATLSDPDRRKSYDSRSQRTAVSPSQESQLFAETEQRWGEWAQQVASAAPPPVQAAGVRSERGSVGVGWLVTGALSGAVFGATVGGPAGALVGASVGAVGGLWRAKTGQHLAGTIQKILATPETQKLLVEGVTTVLSSIEEKQTTTPTSEITHQLVSEEALQAVPCSRAEDGRQDVCKVCQEHVINSLLLPCRHIAVCSACAVAVLRADRKCPICRAPIQEVQAPVYIS
eukprot:EG_transcript_17047